MDKEDVRFSFLFVKERESYLLYFFSDGGYGGGGGYGQGNYGGQGGWNQGGGYGINQSA